MSDKQLQSLLNKLENSHLPLMGKTVDVLRTADNFIHAHSSQLTETILQDPNMTASVLKLANSALYSRNKKIATVSRAILALGFEAIRSICVSAMVLETVGNKANPHLLKAVALSFQSAIQAKMLAMEKEQEDAESIYIAALLYNLGEIAFWSSGDELTHKMNAAMDNGMTSLQAQKKILGFPFNQLTHAMTQQWHISDVLQEALVRKDSPDSSSRAVVLSNKLTRAISNGWDHPEVIKLMASASKYAACNIERLQEITIESAEISVTTLRAIGLKQASQAISLPSGSKIDENGTQSSKNTTEFIQPNEKLQMSILRDLSMLALEGKHDVNVVLQLVLEGVLKGIGMDRALVALINPTKKTLVAKYIVQAFPSSFKEKFNLPLNDAMLDPMLSEVIQSKKVLCTVKLDDSETTLSSPLINDLLYVKEFVAGPLVMENKCVGIFYADRTPSGRNITQDAFEAFEFFVSQASLCLRNLEG